MAARRLSLLDQAARPWAVSAFAGKRIFKGGWGRVDWFEDLRRIALATQGGDLGPATAFVRPDLEIEYSKAQRESEFEIVEGRFESPAAKYLPLEARVAHFALYTSKRAFAARNSSRQTWRPLVVLLAPTGDHGFLRRRMLFAKPLLDEGISSLILENPFYGSRKPAEQWRSALLYVCDLLSMGAGLVSETLSLLNHFEAHSKHNLFGVSGASLGGQMAAHVAVSTTRPLAIVPCITPYSAAPVFTEGVLKDWCDWRELERQMAQFVASARSVVLGRDGREPSTAAELLFKCLNDVTDMRLYPKPAYQHATIQVAAAHDAYTPRPGALLREHWDGSQLRWVKGGHIKAYIVDFAVFRTAIVDALNVFAADLESGRVSVPRL